VLRILRGEWVVILRGREPLARVELPIAEVGGGEENLPEAKSLNLVDRLASWQLKRSLRVLEMDSQVGEYKVARALMR